MTRAPRCARGETHAPRIGAYAIRALPDFCRGISLQAFSFVTQASRPAQDGPYRCDRLQMPNTINATNPMPTNSTTSATESYSSQCRLPESMMFHPCFKWTARIGRQLPTRSSGDLPPPPPADEGPLWPPCPALVLRHDRNGLARNHREQQKESQLRDI